VGLASALELTTSTQEEEVARLLSLRDRLIEGVLGEIPDVQLTGHPVERLPHHASFAFCGIEGASVVVALDVEGIATSSGAACAEGEPEPSSVLNAMGFAPDWGIGAVRFSLGKSNTQDHVDTALKVLPPLIARLREES
jgi:cysteine desulfurase